MPQFGENIQICIYILYHFQHLTSHGHGLRWPLHIKHLPKYTHFPAIFAVVRSCIYNERSYNNNKTKHNKTVCIFYVIYYIPRNHYRWEWRYLSCTRLLRALLLTPLIARFIGPTWGPSGADRTQVAPYWPREFCYLGHNMWDTDFEQERGEELRQHFIIKIQQYILMLWGFLSHIWALGSQCATHVI